MSSAKWHPFCLGLNVLIAMRCSCQANDNDSKLTNGGPHWRRFIQPSSKAALLETDIIMIAAKPLIQGAPNLQT